MLFSNRAIKGLYPVPVPVAEYERRPARARVARETPQRSVCFLLYPHDAERRSDPIDDDLHLSSSSAYTPLHTPYHPTNFT